MLFGHATIDEGLRYQLDRHLGQFGHGGIIVDRALEVVSHTLGRAAIEKGLSYQPDRPWAVRLQRIIVDRTLEVVSHALGHAAIHEGPAQ